MIRIVFVPEKSIQVEYIFCLVTTRLAESTTFIVSLEVIVEKIYANICGHHVLSTAYTVNKT